MSTSSIRRIHLLGFVDEVRHIHENMPDRRFCFVLGAGASKPSGIPTAGELGLNWLKKLHIEGGGTPGDFGRWLREGGHGIEELPPKTSISDIAAIAGAYPAIYHSKWGHDRAQGHAEIERHIEAAKPSYGYYALAEILASDDLANPSRHNVVITPNFDNLPAEALGALGKKIPIVIGHSAIADFARPTLRRPLIIKFHHDFLLSPKSDPKDVGNMDIGYSKALGEIFRLYTPIVIGYGGNDGSLMGLLENLPEKSIPGGILWCWRKGDPPGARIEAVVSKQAGSLIEISGFDELMTLLEAPFGHVFSPGKLSERATERAKELTAAKEHLAKKAESGLAPAATPGSSGERGSSPANSATASAESSALLDALSTGVALTGATDPEKKATLPWWHWQNRINAVPDLDEKERLFEEGLRATQNAPQLLGNYASFLQTGRKDYARAEEYYFKALAADPNDADYLGNYAIFLTDQRKDEAQAEEYFLRALTAEPDHANNLGNYANFLQNWRKDDARAEEYYLKAIAADPNHPTILGNYASFLQTQRKDNARAEEYYVKALSADPNRANNLGNYATFLQSQRKDDARAEEYYLKALAADPNNAINLGNYANFLQTRCKDDELAEKYYLKALDVDPENSSNLGNYANFLKSRRKDDGRAEEYYSRALAIDPSNSANLANYANFLKNQRKDDMLAEEYYLKALAVDPNRPSVLGNYANFLHTQRQNDALAEEYYSKALAADPDNASNLGNYASFLNTRRTDDARAEEYYLKALAADPDHATNLYNYAGFLQTQRKDDARAEEYYLKAIAADPTHPVILGSFAKFLQTRRKDAKRAEEYYVSAVAADPTDANILGNYANFLRNVRKDDDRAEEYYLKAIAANPNDPAILANYANFLKTYRKDDLRAEEYYKKALTINPDHPGVLGSYATFLQTQRKDKVRAEEYYLKALAADLNHPAILGNYAQFLIGCERFAEAELFAKRAWAELSDSCDMAVGEVAFARWLLAVVAGKDGESALGRLKSLLQVGYAREPWSFDDILTVCLPRITEEQGRLARKLAAAILDESKLADVDSEPTWSCIQEIPLDTPWPDEPVTAE